MKSERTAFTKEPLLHHTRHKVSSDYTDAEIQQAYLRLWNKARSSKNGMQSWIRGKQRLGDDYPTKTMLYREIRRHRKHQSKIIDKRRSASVIKKHLTKEDVVYGSHALNAQLPKRLRREPHDIDIYTPMPKKKADRLVAALNKKFRRQEFYTERTERKGHVRIISKTGDLHHADISKRHAPAKTVIKGGVRYEHIGGIEHRAKKMVRLKSLKHRRKKDLDTLERIRLAKHKK